MPLLGKYCPKWVATSYCHDEERPKIFIFLQWHATKSVEKENWKLFPLLFCYCCSFFKWLERSFLETMKRGRNISDGWAADINQASATTRLVKTIDGNTQIFCKLNYWWMMIYTTALPLPKYPQIVPSHYLWILVGWLSLNISESK